jgi:dihydrolipoamide dehydrogenase
MMSKEIKAQVVVLGSGPAGYSAAFRCADLGLDTVLIEKYNTLGGVCLNVGCIPSKALLHVAKVIEEAKAMAEHGVIFGEPQTDINKIRLWKDKVITQLTGGLGGMAKMRKVNVVNGYGKFTGPNSIVVEGVDGQTTVTFDNAIIAAGSRPIKLPFIPHEDPRIWDSTDALELKEVPEKLLIMGGGIIGLEMGTVYHALGSDVDVVEMFDQVIPAADKDIIKVFTKRISKKFNLMLETKVTAVEAKEDGIYVSMEGKKAPAEPTRYDAVLVAIGRVPNGQLIDAEKAGINVDERGFIHVDKQMRTNVAHIHAIGDVVGQPMLAHKGVHEGHVAAEVISGKKHYFDPKVIPSIAYTEPEVAWVGKTEKEAKAEGINYEVSTFPWAASGRAIASDCADGMTKMIFDKDTHRVIGGAIVGTNGGELLGEIGLAIEMGCDAEDIALTIHAHPTLHESIGLAAEVFEGSITDLPNWRFFISDSFINYHFIHLFNIALLATVTRTDSHQVVIITI